jgi:amino acid transporter
LASAVGEPAGPAFGGATGVLFYICYCINSAFNATAMVEDIITVAFDEPEQWHFTALYHGTLFLLLLVALAGADTFARLNAVLFFALISSALVALGCLMFSPEHVVKTLSANGTHSCHHIDPSLSEMPTPVTHYRPSTELFRENFGFAFTEKNDVC